MLGVARSLALLKPKINVLLALAVAENSIDAKAYKVSLSNRPSSAPSSPTHSDRSLIPRVVCVNVPIVAACDLDHFQRVSRSRQL